MAWEKRYNRLYYYRTRREGGRVVREYVGRGPSAERAAAQVEARRAGAARLKALRDQATAADAPLGDLAALTDLLLAAALAAAGYRRHDRGAWRRKRC